MSTASLYPTSKPENAIYLAFGTSLALWLERWLSPTIFEDIASAFAITVLLGSIIASILFYIKLDRSVIWLLKKRTYKKYGLDMNKIIVQTHIAIETWRMKVVEVWEDPKDRSMNALDRLFKGNDTHDDVWSLNGAFYFSCSIPFLLYSAALTLETVFLVGIVLITIVWGFIVINYGGFLKRCSRIALFRTIQEQYSVFKARDPGDRPSMNWFIGTSEKEEAPIKLVLQELERMLELRDWRGFVRRFQYLEQEFSKWFDDVENILGFYFFEKWAKIVEEKDSILSTRYFEQTKSLKRVLLSAILQNMVKNQEIKEFIENLLSVDETDYLLNPALLFKIYDRKQFDPIIKNFGEWKFMEPLGRAFNSYVNKSAIEDEVVEKVLIWYASGAKEFERGLFDSITKCGRELANSIVKELLSKADFSEWKNAGTRVATILSEMKREGKTYIPPEVVAQLIRSENTSILNELTIFLDLENVVILREYVLLLKSANPLIVDIGYKLLKGLKIERLLSIIRGFIVTDKSNLRTASTIFLLRVTKELKLQKGVLNDLLSADKPAELIESILVEAISSKIGIPKDEFEPLRRTTSQSLSGIHGKLTWLETAQLLY